MFSDLVARNSRRSRRENGLFFASLLVSIVSFYMLLSLSGQDVMRFLQKMESGAVTRLLALIPVMYVWTLAILFFLIYFAERFQLERRRHEFGVYRVLGMKKKDLFRMLMAEDLRTSGLALLIGLPLALLLAELVSLLTVRLTGIGILGHQISFSLPAVLFTAVGFLGIKLLASLILSGKIVREEIGSLLSEVPEGTKKQLPGPVYALSLVVGIVLLAVAYYFAISGEAWMYISTMALVLASGTAGTVLLFFGLRFFIDKLARASYKKNQLQVFNFRQVEETVIHRSGTLAICSLLILAALCCFGAGLGIIAERKAETHALDYTFSTYGETTEEEKQMLEETRTKLKEGGLDSLFSDLFEVRTGYVRTTEDYDNAVQMEKLKEAVAALPDSGEKESLQYRLEYASFPYLIAQDGYNHVLKSAGLPELSLGSKEVAIYMDPEFASPGVVALLEKLLPENRELTIDGISYLFTDQVKTVSMVTDRSLTLSFALILPDEAFDFFTKGQEELYMSGVLSEEAKEGTSLMQAIMETNEKLDALGISYESYLQNMGRELFFTVAASYLTIYLAIIFLVVANTIIGVQFLMTQQKAQRRYRTLVSLGAGYETLCRAAGNQINWFFGLPIAVAAVSSVFGLRSLFSGILSSSLTGRISEMMWIGGAVVVLLVVVELIYMLAVKRASNRYLLGLMAPKREE